MGFDLYNDHEGYFRFDVWSWDQMLKLGRAFGWQPAGTVLEPEDHIEIFMHDFWFSQLDEEDLKQFGPGPTPEEDAERRARREENALKWDGTYRKNYGQTVTAEDALALATAVERALDHIPDERIPVPGERIEELPDGTRVAHIPLGGKDGENLGTLFGNLGAFFNDNQPLKQDETFIQHFSGDKDYLRAFIRYCRQGRFKVY